MDRADSSPSPWIGAPASFLGVFTAVLAVKVIDDFGWRWYAVLVAAVISTSIVYALARVVEVQWRRKRSAKRNASGGQSGPTV